MTSGLNALLTAAGGTAGRLIPDTGRRRLRPRDDRQGRDGPHHPPAGQVRRRLDQDPRHRLAPQHPGRAHRVVPRRAAGRHRHRPRARHPDGRPLPQRRVDPPGRGGRRRPHPARRRTSTRRPWTAIVESGAAVAPTFTFLANLADHGARVGASTTQVDLFRGEIEATAGDAAHGPTTPASRSCADPRAGSPSPRTATGTPARWSCSSTPWASTPLEAITCATRNGAIALRTADGLDRRHRHGRRRRRPRGRRRPGHRRHRPGRPRPAPPRVLPRPGRRPRPTVAASASRCRARRSGCGRTQPLTWDLVHP